MPGPGPQIPILKRNQRLTPRLLPAALDVEHEGDVVTLHDSAQRHAGVRMRSMLWFAWTLLALAGLMAAALVLGGGNSLRLWAQGGTAIAISAGLGVFLIVLTRLPQARTLRIDLRTGEAELRWPDSECVRWCGDVDGLRLIVCPFKAKTPLGVGTVAEGFAALAVLEGHRVPPGEIAAGHGPVTATVLHTIAVLGRATKLETSDTGWMLLATGDEPNALADELRSALPVLMRVVGIDSTSEVLRGPVDARLLGGAKPRGR